MNNFVTNYITNNFIIRLLVFNLLVFILRMTVPFAVYIFIFLSVPTTILVLWRHLIEIKKFSLPIFFRKYVLFIFSGSFLVFALVFTSSIHIEFIKEIINFFSFLMIMFLLHISIKNDYDFEILKHSFRQQIIYSAIIIAIVGIIKYSCLLVGIRIPYISLGFWAEGTSIVADNNYYSLLSLMAIIIIFYLFLNPQKRLISILWQLFLFILSINVFLSGSRRGIVILFLLGAAWLGIIIVSFVKRRYEKIRFFASNTKLFLLTVIVGIFLISGFVFLTSYQLKNKLFQKLNVDMTSLTHEISSMVYQYLTIATQEISYKQVDDFLWQKSDSDYNVKIASFKQAKGNTTEVFPLYGKNKEQLPIFEKGYLIDKNTPSSSWYSDYIRDSVSQVWVSLNKVRVEKGFFYKASAYCFASSNFEADELKLIASGFGVKGDIRNLYDYRRKGEWQKLNVFFYASIDTLISTSIVATKYHVGNFKNESGHAIWALPSIEKINYTPTQPALSWGRATDTVLFSTPIGLINGCRIDENSDYTYNTSNNNISTTKTITAFPIIKGRVYTVSTYCYASPNFNGSGIYTTVKGKVNGRITAIYNIEYAGQWRKLVQTFEATDNDVAVLQLNVKKDNTNSTNNLTGEVVIANPQWSHYQFDALNPGSGWGSTNNNYPTITDIKSSVPANALAYKIDNTSLYSTTTKNGNSSIRSNAFVGTIKTKKEKPYNVSILCFVSNDCNSDLVEILSNKNLVEGKAKGKYNLKKKGTWQKLSYQFKGKFDTTVNIHISVHKKNASTIQALKGYVLFAYPQFDYDTTKYEDSILIPKKINTLKVVEKDTTPSFSIIQSIRNYFDRLLYSDIVDEADRYYADSNYLAAIRKYIEVLEFKPDNEYVQKQIKHCYTQPKINEQIATELQNRYNINLKDTVQTDTLTKVTIPIKRPKIDKDSVKSVNSLGENLEDELTEEIDSSVIQGVEYIDYEIDNFSGQRTDRWAYAWQLWAHEYTWWQKIIGDGFNYRYKYGLRYEDDIKRLDYPHNPYLSILLYGGVIGLLAAVLLTFYVAFLYFKNFKRYPEFAILAGVVFLFSMFSGNSIFSMPVLAVMMAIPFIDNRFEHINPFRPKRNVVSNKTDNDEIQSEIAP